MRFHFGVSLKPKQLIPLIIGAIGVVSALLMGGVIK